MRENSRKRKKAEDHEKELENNRRLLQKHRHAETPEARLKQFQQAVMFGPIFICICCHIKMFKSNVREFTKAVIAQFEEKIPLESCIADMNVVTKVQTEQHYLRVPAKYKDDKGKEGTRFICETCLRYLKNGRIPPSCVMNQLHLHQTDEELKRQDLVLTELVGALIAKSCFRRFSSYQSQGGQL